MTKNAYFPVFNMSRGQAVEGGYTFGIEVSIF